MKKQFITRVLILALCMLVITSTSYATESPVNPIQSDHVSEVIEKSTGEIQGLYGQLMDYILGNIKFIIIGLLVVFALSFFRFMRTYMLRLLFYLIFSLTILITAPIIASKLLNY